MDRILPAVLIWTVLSSVAPASVQEAVRGPDAAAGRFGLVVDYDVVYVRAPRFGDRALSDWSDTADPWTPDAGAELWLWHHEGGWHERLFPLREHLDGGLIDSPRLGAGSVTDPYVSHDGNEVAFAYFHDLVARGLNGLSLAGSDVYRLDLQTREVLRLTHQEFTPNTGNGGRFQGNGGSSFGSNPRTGVFNSGPAWLPGAEGPDPDDGRIVFTSTRNNFVSNDSGPEQRASELFVMDADGRNVERIAAFNLARALHPFVLSDGRVIFTSWENQGLRSHQQFPLWQILPDGTGWMSLSGAFEPTMGHHFHTETGSGDVVTTVYYNFNNNGFGELVRFPVRNGGPRFWGVEGKPSGERAGISFDPRGAVRITPFTWKLDQAAPVLPNGSWAGKFTHPSAAPGNHLLTVYTPGPADHRNAVLFPTYDGGIYLIPRSAVVSSPEQLVPLFPNDPAYNEQYPRAVVPYARVHGVAQPAWRRPLENDGRTHPALTADTPFALIGSSSVTYRETHPQGGDPFNVPPREYRWTYQGTDTSLFEDDDVFALRLLALDPLSDLGHSHGFRPAFWSFGGERARILGEIPLRKDTDPGDTSFLVKIPADTPFTFQALDDRGRSLFTSQTWHSLRPGEMRTCGGCHVHSQDPLPFETTAAARPGYEPPDLTRTTPLLQIDEATGETSFAQHRLRHVTVEYARDVRPILEAKCVTCHRADPPPPLTFDDVGRLRLDADDEVVVDDWVFWPGTYFRLARDDRSEFSAPSVNEWGDWFLPQATRYVRAFQSRQSLLAWKIWGERLDGRTNADRPTERVPGDAATLPLGSDPLQADLDYEGTRMPPPASGAPDLTYAERLTLSRWIDLGLPIDLARGGGEHARGWFADDLRPVLSVSPTLRDALRGPVAEVAVGAYDLESGLDRGSLVVSFDVPIGNVAAGTNLAAGIQIRNQRVVRLPLPASIDLSRSGATLTVRVRDRAGHTTETVRTFGS